MSENLELGTESNIENFSLIETETLAFLTEKQFEKRRKSWYFSRTMFPKWQKA